MKGLLFLIAVLVLLTSCGKPSELVFIDNSPKHEEAITTVGFSELKSKIIEPHCLSCHKKSGTEQGISKWIVPGEPEASKMYLTIKEGQMPKKAAPLSTADLEIVEQYILNLVAPRSLETIEFETLKAEILLPHCLKCHKRMDNEEALVKWINKDDPRKSKILRTVIEGKMPKNASPLTKEQIAVIRKYVNRFVK